MVRMPQPENSASLIRCLTQRAALSGVGDAAPEQVADVRGERVDLALVPVERQREEAALRDPEVVVEAPLERPRPRAPAASAQLASLQTSRARRAVRTLGVVDVALQLAGRARRRGQRAVGERDRVPGVLPALVLEPGLRVAALVLDVAVAVAVAVAIDPGDRRARLALQLARQRAVARPALVLLEQDQEQRRRVGAAVVGRVRPLLEGGHLAEPQLVQDLARLLVAERIVDPALEQRQRAQRGRRPARARTAAPGSW